VAPQAADPAPTPAVEEVPEELPQLPAESADGLAQRAAQDGEDPPDVASTTAPASLLPDAMEGGFDEVFAVDLPADTGPPASPGPVVAEPPVRPGRRSGRVPVPSWEDVVLGTKPSSD